MEKLLERLVNGFVTTGDLLKDGYNFLIFHNKPKTAQHCVQVAEEAARLARRFGLEEQAALLCGYMHDISAVLPNGERLQAANLLGIDILPEEEEFPPILHQKLSRVMADRIFNIRSSEILDAIGCHTTLRANATPLDMALFLADKLQWDQQDRIPCYADMRKALETSLESGSLVYIQYLLDHRESMKVVHPWLLQAYEDIKKKVGK